MLEDYTIDGYLGNGFQLKVLWQLLTEPEFGNNIFPYLKVGYFDDPNHKRFFIIMKEYFNEYGKIPNLQNKSIYHAIAKYSQKNNPVDEEILTGIVENIKNWNDRVLNKNLDYDGDVVQKSIYNFIKQGEYCDLADYIVSNVKSGFSDETNVKIDEKTKKISEIGLEEDDGSEVFEDIDDVLVKDYREPIGTGIKAIDDAMGGGLGRAEMGIILAGTGVGKSTILTKIANEAHSIGKNVLQIVFEDNIKDIKRKHYTIWSDIRLSEIDDNTEIVAERVRNHKSNELNGKLIIKKFPQEGVTIPIIRNYIDRYKKKWGVSFDIIILDYIDCLDPHIRTGDRNEDELLIVKAFESMASEYNIPCWTAIQANRSGIGNTSGFIETSQMGGNIKRAQKTHFLMSIAKSSEQKRAGLANIAILKSRFAADGQEYGDATFDNDQIKITTRDCDIKYYKKKMSHPNTKEGAKDEDGVDKFNKKLTKINDLEKKEVEEVSEEDKKKKAEEKNKDVMRDLEEMRKKYNYSDP